MVVVYRIQYIGKVVQNLMIHGLSEKTCSDQTQICQSSMRVIQSHTRWGRVIFTQGVLMGASHQFLYVYISAVAAESHWHHFGSGFEPQLFMNQLLLLDDRIIHILFYSFVSFESNIQYHISYVVKLFFVMIYLIDSV